MFFPLNNNLVNAGAEEIDKEAFKKYKKTSFY